MFYHLQVVYQKKSNVAGHLVYCLVELVELVELFELFERFELFELFELTYLCIPSLSCILAFTFSMVSLIEE